MGGDCGSSEWMAPRRLAGEDHDSVYALRAVGSMMLWGIPGFRLTKYRDELPVTLALEFDSHWKSGAEPGGLGCQTDAEARALRELHNSAYSRNRTGSVAQHSPAHERPEARYCLPGE